MGHAERTSDQATIAAQASARYGSRGVPTDWFVDPADPEAAERYRAEIQQRLEDEATAFLAAHEALADGGHAPADLDDFQYPAPDRGIEPASPGRAEQAVWIGLPGLGNGWDDEGELGWQTDALCAQTDPEAFFPEKGGSTRDAKKVCGACNVRAECLEYALANDERFGIWGGLSERERRRLRKRAV